MIGNRGVVALTLIVTALVVALMGFSDKLKSQRVLCDAHKIDRCAKTGGLNH